MLSKVVIELKGETEDINFRAGSVFQGALMEVADASYVELLHTLPINPYSQYVLRDEDKYTWTISTLTKEAFEKLIAPLLQKDEIILRHKDLKLKLKDKTLVQVPKEKIVEETLFSMEDFNNFTFKFMTPTSFKSEGRYVNVPTVRLLLRSVLNKFDAFGEEMLLDDELTEQMIYHTYFSRFRLYSSSYPLESVRIPSFIGRVDLRSSGGPEMKRVLKLIEMFSEYSGVGIKCSMGMGGIISGGDDVEGKN